MTIELALLILAVSIIGAALLLSRGSTSDAATQRAVNAVERIERILTGSQSRGAGGENVLAIVLGEFPPDLLLRDFKLGGRVCEFALRLPDGRFLPIDSKWTAVDLVERLESARDRDREKIRREIERNVLKQAQNAKIYLDPGRTAPFAVIALPDAVYECCRKVHADAYSQRVILCPYSTAPSFILAVFTMHASYGSDLDERRLQLYLGAARSALEDASATIESQLSRAITQAQNAVGLLRTSLSKSRDALSQAVTKEEEEEEDNELQITADEEALPD